MAIWRSANCKRIRRFGSQSYHFMNKEIRYLIMGVILLPIIMLLNVILGQADIPFVQLLNQLVHNPHSTEAQIFYTFRMPRTVLGVLAGASLAVVGLLLQTTLRNSLVSASTLGINAGAFFVATAATVFLPVWMSGYPVLLSFLGGLLAIGLVYMIAGRAANSPLRMALSGMIVTMLLGSLTNAIQIMFENETRQLLIWGNGTLVQNDWKNVLFISPWIVLCLSLAFIAHKQLDVIRLGEEMSGALGQRVGVIKLSIILLCIFIAATIVSVTGPIGFVGLVAPHLIKMAGFRKHITMLPATALCGALLLLLADTLTYRPGTITNQVPVGAVMALIGAPWLLFMAHRLAKKHQLGSGLQHIHLRSLLPQQKLTVPLLVAFLTVVLAVVFVAGIFVSSASSITLKDVLAVLIGQGDKDANKIVLTFRMPRMVAAAIAGAMLAAAGLLVQGSVRNPLADPSIIGVTSGAGAGVLALIWLDPSATAIQYSLAALIGALIASALVLLVTWKGKFQPGYFIMAGIAISAAFSALIQILILQTPFSVSAQIWLSGSTYAIKWVHVHILLWTFVIVMPIAWLYAKRIELLGFDDQASVGLGLKPVPTRFIALLIGVILSAVTVSQVGTIGFIGLLAPHAAHMLGGHSFRGKLILSLLIGAIILSLSDIIGRVILLPNQIPSGTIVAIVGAPYLFYLIAISRRKS
ncbi:iron ABC transporter permease [Paenibacillus sp. GCM10012307]|uniref:Iron ABC transporter permease n=1 Tax=Paenibacillus roseus TaxID=2798579 RepID=A0A934J6A6_9BACL|nr:iron ABC transporter permease [Paenibacillus roseus]MBJ6362524.1 iron ABC transporter permease [Paenibacillus roseus]